MRKLHVPITDEHPEPPRRGSKARRLAVLICIAAVIAIPVGEGAAICISQWREVMGTNNEVRTPALDAIGDHLGEAHSSTRTWVAARFQHLPWNPSYVLPIAAIVTALGMVMLRR